MLDNRAFVYAMKPEPLEGGNEPQHWLCANCFEDRRRSHLQAGRGNLKRASIVELSWSSGRGRTEPSDGRPRPDEGTDADSFDFDPSTRELKAKSGVTYDFEAKNDYRMTVRVVDGNGGTDTIEVRVTLLNVRDEQSATPDKPTLAAVSGSSTSLTASWTKPGRNGGPDITGYDVQYREGTTGTWMDFTHSDTAITTTITGLTADTSYQVQVRALNGDTPSDWSDPSDLVRIKLEVTLHLSDDAVLEDATPITVTATVSPASPVAFTVEISASPVAPATDDEFELSTNRTLSFAANATESVGLVTVRPVDDDEPEPPDVVTISGVVSNPAIPNPDDVTLTIHTNDVVIPPGLEVTLHLSDNEPFEDTGRPTVTASVSPATPVAFTMEISASPVAPATGDDFTLSTNRTLSFAANATGSTGTVRISPVGDEDPEPDDVVTVSGVVSNPAIRNPDDVTLTILNDDADLPHDIAIDAPAAVDEGAGTVDVTVTITTLLDIAPVIDVQLFYRTRPGTATHRDDYTRPQGLGNRIAIVPVSEFSANADGTAWVARHSFEIGIVDDGEAERDETIVFEINSNSNSSGTEHTIVIRENDTPVMRNVRVVNGPGAAGMWSAGEQVELEVRYTLPVAVEQPSSYDECWSYNADGTCKPPGPYVAVVFRSDARPGYGEVLGVALARYVSGSGTATLRFAYTVGTAEAGARGVEVVDGAASHKGGVGVEHPELRVRGDGRGRADKRGGGGAQQPGAERGDDPQQAGLRCGAGSPGCAVVFVAGVAGARHGGARGRDAAVHDGAGAGVESAGDGGLRDRGRHGDGRRGLHGEARHSDVCAGAHAQDRRGAGAARRGGGGHGDGGVVAVERARGGFGRAGGGDGPGGGGHDRGRRVGGPDGVVRGSARGA